MTWRCGKKVVSPVTDKLSRFLNLTLAGPKSDSG